MLKSDKSMKETGLHITFPGGEEVWIEFDGESYCDILLGPVISEDVVFFSKGKPNRLRFNATVNDMGRITWWDVTES